MAYAFELLADKDGKGHVAATTAPPLTVVNETPGSVGGTVPATLALTLGAPATFGPFTPGVAKDVHGVDDRERRSPPRATRR